jgi:hypothetical protein
LKKYPSKHRNLSFNYNTIVIYCTHFFQIVLSHLRSYLQTYT